MQYHIKSFCLTKLFKNQYHAPLRLPVALYSEEAVGTFSYAVYLSPPPPQMSPVIYPIDVEVITSRFPVHIATYYTVIV